jgi:hypothetical protein
LSHWYQAHKSILNQVSYQVFFACLFLETILYRLLWNTFCSLDWPQTWDPPDSVSQVLGLQMCTTMPNLHVNFFQFFWTLLGFELRALITPPTLHVSFLKITTTHTKELGNKQLFLKNQCLQHNLVFQHLQLSTIYPSLSTADRARCALSHPTPQKRKA